MHLLNVLFGSFSRHRSVSYNYIPPDVSRHLIITLFPAGISSSKLEQLLELVFNQFFKKKLRIRLISRKSRFILLPLYSKYLLCITP